MAEYNFRNLNNNLGIGLVESVLAIAFAIVVIVAVLGLINFNLQNSTSVSIRQEAVRDQSRVLENLKLIKESNFNILASLTNCTASASCSLSNSVPVDVSLSCNTSSDLYTCFSVNKVDASTLRIELITYFKIRGQSFSTPLSTIFTNWRQ